MYSVNDSSLSLVRSRHAIIANWWAWAVVTQCDVSRVRPSNQSDPNQGPRLSPPKFRGNFCFRLSYHQLHPVNHVSRPDTRKSSFRGTKPGSKTLPKSRNLDGSIHGYSHSSLIISNDCRLNRLLQKLPSINKPRVTRLEMGNVRPQEAKAVTPRELYGDDLRWARKVYTYALITTRSPHNKRYRLFFARLHSKLRLQV